jgi:hypothetical protein
MLLVLVGPDTAPKAQYAGSKRGSRVVLSGSMHAGCHVFSMPLPRGSRFQSSFTGTSSTGGEQKLGTFLQPNSPLRTARGPLLFLILIGRRICF